MAESELMTIARPYARAVFAHALEQPDGLASWGTRLEMLRVALDTLAVRQALDNPRLTTADETALLRQLMGAELGEDGQQFLEVLGDYGRLLLLPAIATLFEQLKSGHEKTLEVAVTSAFEVTEREESLLRDALKRKLQRDIKLETAVDRRLLGGVIVKAGDTVIDDSVRGRLTKLSYALH